MPTSSRSQSASWIGLYLLLVLAPLGVALLGPVPDARGFWIEFGVALGFVGLAMMGAQFALTARFPRIAGSLGQDTMLQFHAQAGVVAFLFVMAHPTILIVTDPDYLAYFDPRVNLPRAFALSTVTGALILVVLLPFLRKRLHIPYEWWRFTHGILAGLVLLIGLAHVIMVGQEGGYVSTFWKQAIWVIMSGTALGMLIRVRFYTPWAISRRPYRLAEVRKETGDVNTIVLEADGHKGMPFRPGQFAWLTLNNSPWTLQQHPFSFSASAEQPTRLEFTIKELGDFTSQLDQAESGATAYLEGPYGAFHHGDDTDSNLAFMAGGIGVTPIMSMLRTIRDRGESRSLILLYANKSEADIVFDEELDAMQQQLDLRLIHILESPGSRQRAETGLLTPELMKKHLPFGNHQGWRFFICGPEPMMDIAERTLLENGVSPTRIRSERFNIV